MKNLLLATASIVALGAIAPAFGADLAAQPVQPLYGKAPQLVAAMIYDWSGYYVGLNGGWGSSANCWDFNGGTPEGCHDATGGTVGGQIGYRRQTGQIVLGVEGQGNWAGLTGSNDSVAFADINQTKIDAFGLITGQIGYAVDNVLFYGKGGAAVTSNTYQISSTLTGAQLGKSDHILWGGALGAGIEYGFAPSWSVSLEYDHLFMQPGAVHFAAPAGGTDRVRQDFDLLTARLNYKFGGPFLLKY
ncbi:porin family protein [Bradyrhizobium sp. 24]|uniref:outer membrane protein n=1 Tax=unclassified Bradyrhizobium TaxID=2631580 RepID=UPI001FFB722A|nr:MULTISPECIES: outer membrane beta-barrel protein [unclassified Bradyrhizobium]MCK1302832.1 porin family protein [Bradyrhizobium sp. 37]MCK1379555.1 porin family protein [Bradyrhizobium sp. 24]MCK1767798.1 porin family protein [Bradyrhizobium sp. 134]